MAGFLFKPYTCFSLSYAFFNSEIYSQVELKRCLLWNATTKFMATCVFHQHVWLLIGTLSCRSPSFNSKMNSSYAFLLTVPFVFEVKLPRLNQWTGVPSMKWHPWTGPPQDAIFFLRANCWGGDVFVNYISFGALQARILRATAIPVPDSSDDDEMDSDDNDSDTTLPWDGPDEDVPGEMFWFFKARFGFTLQICCEWCLL